MLLPNPYWMGWDGCVIWFLPRPDEDQEAAVREDLNGSKAWDPIRNTWDIEAVISVLMNRIPRCKILHIDFRVEEYPWPSGSLD